MWVSSLASQLKYCCFYLQDDFMVGEEVAIQPKSQKQLQTA
jgi:hypothetical protein